MSEERAFAALTLLVAVSEQAIVELEALDEVPRGLVKRLTRVHDEATAVAQRLAVSRDASSGWAAP